jgi:hypothetical protein
MPATDPIQAFITRWSAAGGAERANYQLFLTELCVLLELPGPDPAREDTRDNAYVFERRVVFKHGDGTESNGFIDLYRRGAFVCEAKKVRKDEGKAFDDALLRARGQAEQYARALPAGEGRPPFVLAVDVGNVIELYAEFTRSGANYTPYPDPQSHRIRLADLRDEAVRERLRAIWLDPVSLDPSRRSAKVTREVAERLAEVARVLEAAGYSAQQVASFLSRCLFSMFAEDVGLLPKRAFVDLLESLKGNTAQFVPLVGELWKAMDRGEFSVAVRADLLKFNGKLFKNPEVLPLNRDQIDLLLAAAQANWREVEPAIFGTLLERALDPEERHSLGAHYTPRAYVERLVLPTIVEPLRADWQNVQGAALVLAGEGKLKEAQEAVRGFLHQLTHVRVLDPACGSGNFLYVTLEHLKRLEGEVLNQLDELGDSQGRLDLAGVSVDPHQLLGIELNPRAAEIAEMVLWIGYLQWHFRTRGNVMPPQPVLKDFHNIECRDAVLAYDRVEFVTDERGVPVTRWDGKTFKKHPVTGVDVPDDRAQIPLERYVHPRKAEWPAADFVVGNPPFIGNKRMRDALGDGYVEALRGAWKDVPDSADFVMYWWDNAAELACAGKTHQFGLITTNSLVQTFNRKVLERHLNAKPPLSLVFAIPDHPWVDSADGAAVRISMTVGKSAPSKIEGSLGKVVEEILADEGQVNVSVDFNRGLIHSNLDTDINFAALVELRANKGIAFTGMYPLGQGFVLTHDDIQSLGQFDARQSDVLKPFVTARDLTQVNRGTSIIDFWPRHEEEARRDYPSLYQWVLTRVKPERDQNPVEERRKNWWLFTRPIPDLRSSISVLSRYIAVPRTAKFFSFQFVSIETVPDTSVVAIASDSSFCLGVLSSLTHRIWSLTTGGALEDRPRYQHKLTFNTFPFPSATSEHQSHIRELAEQLDAHRKKQQAQHAELTLTGLYNVLEKLKSGDALTAKEKIIHEQGLVAVLKTLHDELDRAVLDAYGWSDLAPLQEVVNGNAAPASAGLASREDAQRALTDALLERLVALNAERAAEEAKGLVRWLRPEFQAKGAAPEKKPVQTTLVGTEEEETAVVAVPAARVAWPKELPEQVRLVAQALAEARAPLTEDAIAARFQGRGPWKKRLPQIIDTLIAVGRVRVVEGGKTYVLQ